MLNITFSFIYILTFPTKQENQLSRKHHQLPIVHISPPPQHNTQFISHLLHALIAREDTVLCQSEVRDLQQNSNIYIRTLHPYMEKGFMFKKVLELEHPKPKLFAILRSPPSNTC